MLLEEYRLQRSYVGSFGSYFFPLVIFILSFFLVVIFPFESTQSSSVIDTVHLLMSIYGLAVGGVALMGEQVMTRRLGQVNLLLQLPQVQNISFRRTMAIFYLKEIFFYQLYSMVPFGLGLIAGGVVAGLPLTGTLLVSLTVTMVFGLGMSLSFAISALLTRSRTLGMLAVVLIALSVVILVWTDLVDPVKLVHPLYFHKTADLVWILASFIEMVILSIFAIVVMKERVTSPVKRYRSSLGTISRLLPGNDRKKALLAKEWLELWRSGTLGPVIAGFLAPLLAIYGLVYLLNRGLDADIRFNVVFFGTLIGYFGVMTYSWLNNVEQNESLDVMPVTVSEVIATKLRTYFLLTCLVSTIYIVAVGLIQGEPILIPAGVLVGLSTNFYVAYVTARLTGIRTNTMLLDAVTLMKFTLLVTPPLLVLVVLSFYLEDGTLWSLSAVIIVSAILVLAGLLFRMGIGPRWDGGRFGF